MDAERYLIKTPDYSPWFTAKIGKFQFRQKRISSETEEQNDLNFIFVASSSEELQMRKDI